VVLNDPLPNGRHPCEVPTTCQPPSAYAKDPWPATIRDISTQGLTLTLSRRFERGSGLAIDLPGEDGNSFSVWSRVTEVHAAPGGGWTLSCDFISELSDEEVNVVTAAQAPMITGVLFHVRIRPGEYLRWIVKRLEMASRWPLPKGKIVTFRVGGPNETNEIQLKVKKCLLFGSYWVVDCKLLSELTEEELRAFANSAQGNSAHP
jgi:hypothetical protein